MVQSWRLQLREAEQAYRDGRLDEAGRLLSEPPLSEFLPAQKLLQRVAAGLLDRGNQQLDLGQTMAGWRDLEAAEQLGAGEKPIESLRQRLAGHVAQDAISYLAAGEPQSAIARLDQLAQQGRLDATARRLREASRQVLEGLRRARRGQFGKAQTAYEAAARLCPDVKFFQQAQKACAADAERFAQMSRRLHEMVSQSKWNEALEAAEPLLRLAPDYRPAREAQQRAWEEVGMHLDFSSAASWDSSGRSAAGAHQLARRAANSANGSSGSPRGERFVLWVDAVGGYLVCRGDEIRIGQPTGDGRVDVPILADLSRVHAVLHRDGEGYLLEPVRATQVGGKAIQAITPLADGDLLELGSGVRLRFSRPHPLSRTARLDFLSRHRTQPAVDAILLMAESCVLGPKISSHVRCPDWSQEIVLAGVGTDELYVRGSETFQVDGQPQSGRAPVQPGSTVSGEDYSFSLEAL